MTMIERIARALAVADRLDPDWPATQMQPCVTRRGVYVCGEAMLAPAWHMYRDDACAVIEAMREMSDREHEAAGIPSDVWRGAVDFMLADKPEPAL